MTVLSQAVCEMKVVCGRDSRVVWARISDSGIGFGFVAHSVAVDLIQVVGGKSCVGGIAGVDVAEGVGATAWTEAVSAWVTEGGVAFESVAGGGLADDGILRCVDGGVAFESVEGVAFARLADDFCFVGDLAFAGAEVLKAGVGGRRVWDVGGLQVVGDRLASDGTARAASAELAALAELTACVLLAVRTLGDVEVSARGSRLL